MPTTNTKTKIPPQYGDHLPITTFQVTRIRKNCNWNEDIKQEWVQWVTGDNNCTSLKSLTQAQAVKIIRAQTGETKPEAETKENWGFFIANNKQHSYIRVLLRNANIVIKNDRHGEVADMEGWFAKFLQSSRSPVKMPLKKMKPYEVSKIIVALEGVAVWKNSI